MTLALAVSDCGPCKNSHERILTDTRDWDGFGVDLTGGPLDQGTSFDLVAADKAPYVGSALIVRDGIIESRDATDARSFLVRAENGSHVRMKLSEDVTGFPDDCIGRPVIATGTIRDANSEFVATGIRLGLRP